MERSAASSNKFYSLPPDKEKTCKPAEKSLFPERSVRAFTKAKNVRVSHILKLILHVYCKACCKQLRLLSVTCKVLFKREKHYLMKHFAFLNSACYQYLNFVLRET